MRLNHDDLRDIRHALKTGQLETISCGTMLRLESDIDATSRKPVESELQRVSRETELAKQRFMRARDEYYRLHAKRNSLWWQVDSTF